MEAKWNEGWAGKDKLGEENKEKWQKLVERSERNLLII